MVKTILEETQAKLESFPNFRERRFRGKYLTILALRNTGLELRHEEKRFISLEELSDFAVKYDSYRRMWTEVLSKCENLRGLDYSQKDRLVQDKILSLNYEVGQESNILKMQKLV